MSGPNPYVSNGTCYGAPGSTLDKSFIPCGNTAFGFQTCCGAGNTCLADNACFGYYGSGGTDGSGSYLTYIAGCTDPSYGDETVCPQKEIAGESRGRQRESPADLGRPSLDRPSTLRQQ